jgi:hypothetical protein
MQVAGDKYTRPEGEGTRYGLDWALAGYGADAL